MSRFEGICDTFMLSHRVCMACFICKVIYGKLTFCDGVGMADA